MNNEDKVLQLISDSMNIKVEDIKPTADLTDDIGMDSLDGVELIMFLEEEFAIEIPDDDADKIKTVQDVVDYIEKRMKK